jgi:elongation factor Ts
MSVDAKLVAELRAVTGAGIMDAKKALEIASGDIDKAKEELRKKGVTKAEKRAGRETKEGRIYSYIHSNGKVGAIVEIQCETDFVAKNEDFLSLCHDIAMHVTATQPFYLNSEDIPNDILENKKSLFKVEI